MTKKYTKEQLNAVLNEFADTTRAHFGSYSYATGALQFQLTTLLADAPKHKQAEVLRVFTDLTEKYSKEKAAV
jgi:hypothetical protein